jgi:hypothetical protein
MARKAMVDKAVREIFCGGSDWEQAIQVRTMNTVVMANHFVFTARLLFYA